MAGILLRRGIDTEDKLKHFCYDTPADLSDPFLMKGMQAAVDRIILALQKKEPLVIYGDYDVDGITATSILYRFLKREGADVRFYIPARETEGYGLNLPAVQKLAEEGCKLLITVDNGIAAADIIAQAPETMDIIVTDHHLVPEKIPNAIAVLNPHQKDCRYPYKELAGCGVAYTVCRALALTLHNEAYEEDMELAAMGTIADVVSLTGENRILVREGLRKMRHTQIPGLAALLRAAGIVKPGEDKTISVEDVSFGLAPRLNAAASDLSAGQGALGTLTAVRQMILYNIVHNGSVGLNAEHGFGEFDLTDLLAGHIINIRLRHELHSSPLASCGSLLRVTSGSLLRVLADVCASLLDLVVLDGVLQHNQAALGAGDCAADHDHVQLSVDLYNIQILHSNLIYAHLTGANLALVDTGRSGAGVHGAGMSVDRAAAVSGGGTLCAKTLDNALIAMALGDTGHVDLIAGGKDVSLYLVANLQGAVLQAELLENLLEGNICLLEMAGLRLGELGLFHVLIAQLNCGVAILFHGLQLSNGAGAGFHYGNRNDLAALIEDLGHTHFLADDCFLHSVFPPIRLLVDTLGMST